MVGRGIATERAVGAELIEAEYLIASRRHLQGPGDWLAVSRYWQQDRPLLVEVKGSLDPWQQFRKADRAEMLMVAPVFGVVPMLAWRPPGLGATIWLPQEDWPAS